MNVISFASQLYNEQAPNSLLTPCWDWMPRVLSLDNSLAGCTLKTTSLKPYELKYCGH